MPVKLAHVTGFPTVSSRLAAWLRTGMILALVPALFIIIPRTPLDGPIGGVIALGFALVCCWFGGPYPAALVPLSIVVISRATRETPLFSLPSMQEAVSFATLTILTTAVGLAGQYQRHWQHDRRVHLRNRQEAERHLRESEERFRLLADSAPALIWINGPDGAEFVNRTYREFLGVENEVRGFEWANWIHPDDRDDYMRAYLLAVERRQIFDAQFRFRRHDGQYRWMRSVARPRFGSDGALQGYSGISIDFTERKQFEEALKEADIRKDEFLATLAHELRGPLAPVRNMLEVMKRGGVDDELMQQARDTMERQLSHMVRLVDDLLDISRISRNKIDLKRERVELASVVSQAVEATRMFVDSARQELTVALPPNPIYLHADAVRLAQVFGNLLNNSCKYTPPGGQIWLTAEARQSDVVVKIRDTGVGIASDKLTSVFEMFSQVESSLERSHGGLGIGLALVKRLVEMHEGSVEAWSEGPGRGSEFIVRLPVPTESEEPQPRTEPNRENVVSARRILVVDDNRDSATSLAMLLKLTGNDTRTAHDGLEAVEQAEAYQPDVILLDIGLPKLNGYEACRRIRAQSRGDAIHMVALTGWGQDDDRRKSREAGFDDHLVKPVEYATLAKLLFDSGANAESRRLENNGAATAPSVPESQHVSVSRFEKHEDS